MSLWLDYEPSASFRLVDACGPCGAEPSWFACSAIRLIAESLAPHRAAKLSIQRAVSVNRCGDTTKRFSRPIRRPITREAASSTARCCTTACRVTDISAASVVAVASPTLVNRSRICRRVASARAFRTSSTDKSSPFSLILRRVPQRHGESLPGKQASPQSGGQCRHTPAPPE